MAKMKTYAVEVAVTTKHLVFVQARKPGGAIEHLKTEEGWAESTRYEEGLPMSYDPKRITFGEPKEFS